MVLYFEKEKAEFKVENSLGFFYYLKKYQMFTSVIKGSAFDYNFGIRVSFPCEPNSLNISRYQMEYYKEIQNNWKRIFQEVREKLGTAHVGESLDTIIIPDIQIREKFEFDAKIIFEVFKNDCIDAYVVDLKIHKVMKDGKELINK